MNFLKHLSRHSDRPSSYVILLAVILLSACSASPAAPTAAPTVPAATAVPSPAPAQPTSAAGAALAPLPEGITPEGWHTRGRADAPVTIVEFSDYECPFCGRHEAQTEPLIDKTFLATGQARLVYRDFPIPELHKQAMNASEAANCAADQGKFWPMHDALFAHQADWAGQQNAIDLFKTMAVNLGMDGDTLVACVQANTYAARIQQDITAGDKAGVTGTPSFLINDHLLEGALPYEQFAGAIAGAMSGQAGAPATAPASAGSGSSRAALLAVDPNNPGYTLDGSPTLGNPDAAVLLLEFSDFQCPFCKQYFSETHASVLKNYVDTGKVRFIFKNMPLPIHPNAPKAAEAAECARRQDQFWAMHDKLFGSQDEWAGLSDPSPKFKAYAAALKLTAAQFDTCLDGDKGKSRIDADVQLAQRNGVNATPNFFVLRGDQGARVPGAVPYQVFTQVLDQVLNGKQ